MDSSIAPWGPRSPETPEGAFMEKMEDAQFEWGENSNRWIIPNNKLEKLVGLQNVSAVLRRLSSVAMPMSRDEIERYTGEICKSRKKLYAILFYGCEDPRKCCETICKLVDEGITDSHLPFDRVRPIDNGPGNRPSGRNYKLCIKGHAKCEGALVSNHICLVKALYEWGQKEIDDFSRNQWMVLSPVFGKQAGQIPHFEFEDTILMPFTEDYERTQSLFGGYSEVWPVRFCPGHQDLYKAFDSQGKEPMLAIKRLFSSQPSEFENETEMLIALTSKGHKNLVQLLATYKYRGKYHLLFPYAKLNLRSLWSEMPNPPQNRETYLWALDQMTGLASGLVAVHQYETNMAYNQDIGNPGMTRFRQSIKRNLIVEKGEEKFGRHGDLKPENILWSGELKKSGPSGILQITDFGLGHFHRLESRSRQDPRKINGSETYTPPEISLNELVSRKYDIWSLGCVFLEFATWLLEGAVGLEVFGQRRMEIAPDRINDDTFYSSDTKGAVVRRGVQDWIDHLHRNPRCSDMLHDLLHLVREKLLVIHSTSRVDSGTLYLELKGMIQKAKDSSKYLVGDKS